MGRVKNALIKIADDTFGRVVRYTLDAAAPHYGIPEYLQILARQQSAEYAAEHMANAMLFTSRKPIWDYTLSQVKESGLFLEFGVFKGHSISYFAHKVSVRLYGFDSFEGLQDDWRGTALSRGEFNLSGDLPRVPSNVTLIKGWFDQTLPKFLQEHKEPCAFIHIDGDTYNAAKIVLTLLKDRIVPGTIILFDEFFGYHGWKVGEYLAWQEFVAETGIKYSYIGLARQQVAVKVLE